MNNTIKDALKGLTIFSATQFLVILILLIKSKIIAIYIGPEGIGIHSIFTTSLNFFTALFSFGIYSASISYFSDKKKMNFLYNDLFSIVFFTSFIGCILIILFSSKISIFLFNDSSYKYDIIIISFALIATNIANLKKSALQSLGLRRRLSFSTLLAAILGFSTIIFYIFLDKKGISLAILCSSIFILIAYFFQKPYITKFQYKNVIYKLSEHKSIIILGISMVFGGIYFSFIANLLNAFIVKSSGLAELGKYQAASSISSQATALLFTAITLDYYPKLSNAKNKINDQIEIVSHQLKLVLVLLTPIICFIIIFIKPIILILLTDEFLDISFLASLLLFSMIFKGLQICLGYILLSKKLSKKYFILETLSITVLFLMCFIFYNLFGLIGLGYSFIFGNIFYFSIFLVGTHQISLKAINTKLVKQFLFFVISILVVLICESFSKNIIFTLIKFFTLFILTFYSVFELSKIIDFWQIINKFLKK